MTSSQSKSYDISPLVEIVKQLRGPSGCPWDKEQTHESLTQYAIEEAHELVEVLEKPRSPENDSLIKEELGDVLFQVILHSQLAAEREAFDIHDVIECISTKLIRRHPHVFSDTKVKSSAEVVENWEKIKAAEKNADTSKNPYQISIPALPALQRAFKIGKKTEKLNFDWSTPEDVLLKVEEEFAELREALDNESQIEIEHEIGDVFFSLAQLARHLQIEPEQVLRKANTRFESRFKLMIELCNQDSKDWGKLSLEEKENYWQKAKVLLKKETQTHKN